MRANEIDHRLRHLLGYIRQRSFHGRLDHVADFGAAGHRHRFGGSNLSRTWLGLCQWFASALRRQPFGHSSSGHSTRNIGEDRHDISVTVGFCAIDEVVHVRFRRAGERATTYKRLQRPLVATRDSDLQR